MIDQQRTDRPVREDRDHSLYQPSHDLSERGHLPRRVLEHSAYTAARLHPVVGAAALAGAAIAVGGLWAALKKGNSAG